MSEDLKQKREFLSTFVGTPALENYVDALLERIEEQDQDFRDLLDINSHLKAENERLHKAIQGSLESDSLEEAKARLIVALPEAE